MYTLSAHIGSLTVLKVLGGAIGVEQTLDFTSFKIVKNQTIDDP